MDAERELARQRVVVFRDRYSPNDDTFCPTELAIKWEKAVSKEPFDLGAMKEIVDIALPLRDKYGINFFAFCNHIEAVTRDEIRRSFEGGATP